MTHKHDLLRQVYDIRRPCRLRNFNVVAADASGSDAEPVFLSGAAAAGAAAGSGGAGGVNTEEDAVEVIQGGRTSLSTIGAVGLQAALAPGAKRARLSRFSAASASAAAPLVKRQRAAFRCAMALCVADAQAAFLRNGGGGAAAGSECAAGTEAGAALAEVLATGEWDERFDWNSVSLEARRSFSAFIM